MYLCTLPGSVDQVVAALLDFDQGTGHRAWTEAMQTLERSPQRVLAEWTFRGRLGIAPTVELEFLLHPEGPGRRIDYRITKGTIGLREFSGAYRVRPAAGDRTRSELAVSVFIDSGLAFVNASPEDVEAGLREDARLLTEWLGERTGQH